MRIDLGSRFSYFIQQEIGVVKNSLADSPCYWLILEVTDEDARLYFQFREGQLSSVIPWRRAQLQLVSHIKDLVKLTNQKMLLADLNETKTCNRLLEADSVHLEHVEEEQMTILASAANLASCKPGTFSCPLVWEHRFHLHSRLATLQPLEKISQGMSALKSVMINFAVTNRNNMYVYQEENEAVFYFKAVEIISRQGSRDESNATCSQNPQGSLSNPLLVTN